MEMMPGIYPALGIVPIPTSQTKRKIIIYGVLDMLPKESFSFGK